MNLRKLSDHSVDVDRLPEAPLVLDVGARGFGFVRDILELRPKARVYAMEPDPAVVDPNIPGCTFIRKALTSDARALRKYASFSTGEANFITETVPGYAVTHVVPCVMIEDLMLGLGVAKWDVIKLDCEGSEFGVLESWPGPIADQISVEFHDYQNLARWNDEYFSSLFAGPLAAYEIAQHPFYGVGPGPSMGHWDSLLVLQDEYRKEKAIR